MGKLDGKNALITGGSSGIGLETARLFLAEGAKIVITGSNQKKLDAAATSLGGNAEAICANIADVSAVKKMAEQAGDALGSLHIVFVNAGITAIAPLQDVDEALFDKVMDINVKGVYFTVKHCVPLMQDGGSIILTTSVRNRTGAPGSSLYGASKAAVRSLARMFAAELVGNGIRVNALSPGAVITPIYERLGWSGEQIDSMREKLKALVPMGRPAQAAEIAKAALFLASDDSSYVLGEELVVDGGYATT